jgi:hypothetical protein
MCLCLNRILSYVLTFLMPACCFHKVVAIFIKGVKAGAYCGG